MSVGLSGAGGGLAGDDSFTAEFFGWSGRGGTQTAGGLGSPRRAARPAAAARARSASPGAGGGGGGYYGGGGGLCCPGNGFGGGGGGGEHGFISADPALGITNASTTTGLGAVGANGLATVTASPVVTAVSPPGGATGVSIRTPIVATFDKAMDRAVAAPTFTVVRSSDGAPVAGTVGWYGDAAPSSSRRPRWHP